MFDSFTQQIFMEHYFVRHWEHGSVFIPLDLKDVRQANK